MTKWEELKISLASQLPSGRGGRLSELARELSEWTNPLYQDVVGGRAEQADLTDHGAKEQYCLGVRLKERFPSIFSVPYSSLSPVLRSTLAPRTLKRLKCRACCCKSVELRCCLCM